MVRCSVAGFSPLADLLRAPVLANPEIGVELAHRGCLAPRRLGHLALDPGAALESGSLCHNRLAVLVAARRIAADQPVESVALRLAAADVGRRRPDHLRVMPHARAIAAGVADVLENAGNEMLLLTGPAPHHLRRGIADRRLKDVLALDTAALARRMDQLADPGELAGAGGRMLLQHRVPPKRRDVHRLPGLIVDREHFLGKARQWG